MLKFVACAICLLTIMTGQAMAWTEYKPAIFVGDMEEIYSNIPTFHGYTTEFLNSQIVRQVCRDSASDGVNLDYCK